MLLEVLDKELLEGVRTALAEDIGSGDITAALVPEYTTTTATVVCREAAVLCGMAWFNAVFAELDTGIIVDWQARDGDRLGPDQHICTVTGAAAPILTGERTALNFLQTLSGTATLARRYADAVSGLPVKILDTRKTLPGLRQAQKYAVRTGGCHNHRMGLYDGILIKENHIAATGSIKQAVRAAQAASPGMPIEVEVENLDQLNAALAAGADKLLLDNFSTSQLTAAVNQVAGRATLEASGEIDLETIRDKAATGVNMISIGALTKHIRAINFSMLFR
ncbi:MAG: carboxylating nicotinate-nucleotide diphosphorylase [Thiohalobacterales bacterium]